MREHIIYYFSGTGNSLWTALNIQKALKDCDVVLMKTSPEKPGAVKSMGLVFPCYFSGVPHIVLEFIKNLDFGEQEDTYYYVVVTYGLIIGSALGQTKEAFEERGMSLDFVAPLKSFANYVVGYDMSDKVAERTAQTKVGLQEILPHIVEQNTAKAKNPSALMLAYNRVLFKEPGIKDKNFVVNESCDHCEICVKVCPKRNIRFDEGRPRWLNNCEQCLACLQWCPKRAIDYGERTRKRGRYTHPEITSRMFIDHMGER